MKFLLKTNLLRSCILLVAFVVADHVNAQKPEVVALEELAASLNSNAELDQTIAQLTVVLDVPRISASYGKKRFKMDLTFNMTENAESSRKWIGGYKSFAYRCVLMHAYGLELMSPGFFENLLKTKSSFVLSVNASDIAEIKAKDIKPLMGKSREDMYREFYRLSVPLVNAGMFPIVTDNYVISKIGIEDNTYYLDYIVADNTLNSLDNDVEIIKKIFYTGSLIQKKTGVELTFYKLFNLEYRLSEQTTARKMTLRYTPEEISELNAHPLDDIDRKWLALNISIRKGMLQRDPNQHDPISVTNCYYADKTLVWQVNVSGADERGGLQYILKHQGDLKIDIISDALYKENVYRELANDGIGAKRILSGVTDEDIVLTLSPDEIAAILDSPNTFGDSIALQSAFFLYNYSAEKASFDEELSFDGDDLVCTCLSDDFDFRIARKYDTVLKVAWDMLLSDGGRGMREAIRKLHKNFVLHISDKARKRHVERRIPYSECVKLISLY